MASSPPMLRRYVRPLFVMLAALIAWTASAAAADLPPREAPPHSAKYRMSSKSRVEPTEEWTFFGDDTVSIAVSGKKSRWDYANGGQTILHDQGGRVNVTFGGKTPPKKAVRSKAPFTPIGWEFGYGTVGAVDTDPEALGTTTIAGRECTRLAFDSEDYGKPEFCVTKTGIVLRFANATPTAEIIYEAESVSDDAPAADRFEVPSDHEIEDRQPVKRNLDFL
jgi:hypothetical protein